MFQHHPLLPAPQVIYIVSRMSIGQRPAMPVRVKGAHERSQKKRNVNLNSFAFLC